MTEERDERSAGGGPAGVVPPGSKAVRQSPWTWWWGGVPWLALAILFVALEPRSGLSIFAVALGAAVTIPRYLMWRRTVYYITGDGLIFQRGLLGTPQMYFLPAESFQRIVRRPGVFGNLLGYHAIDIRMREGGRVSLAFVPASAYLFQQLVSLRDQHSDYDEEQELRELAMIEARQRGEEVPDFDRHDSRPANESGEERPHQEPAANQEPDGGRRRGSGATEYRPDIRGYDARPGGNRDGQDR